MPMQDLLPQERPYEKCYQLGPDQLTDVELLSILLGTGVGDSSALDLAREILKEITVRGHGGKRIWLSCHQEQLKKIRGVGPVKAARIVSALTLCKRLQHQVQEEAPCFNQPERIADYLYPILSSLDHEEIHGIFMNTRNRFISSERLASGGLSACGVRPRDVFRQAIKVNAAVIVLAHNHPSGDPEPSQDDIQMTREYVRLGYKLGIPILDHLVIGERNFRSLRRMNPHWFLPEKES